MLYILYTLIIFPIEQVIEICFFYGKTWFGSLGVAILGVSVAVSTLVLPIYLMAEKQQRRQREIEKGLKDDVDHIKSVFKGGERSMLLSAYYRKNNYHPIFALRNSLDLLIQIPFFIAAYHFLHNLEVLKGAPFLFIHDLGSPDKLLFGLNILPVVMTVINIVSVMIYAKNLAAKDKIRLYAMAGVFLALLYNSPAGLVLYWTSNNIYNLIKNIIQNNLKNKKYEERKEPAEIKNNALNNSYTFVLAAFATALLIGLVIPSGIISSGVDEFSYSTTGEFVSPLRFVIHTMLQAGGFFLWGVCLYLLFQEKTRVKLTIAVISLLIMSAMDTFVFDGNYGSLTQELILSNYHKPSTAQRNLSLLVIIALSVAAFFLMRIRRKQIIISILFITVISFLFFGINNVVKTNIAFTNVKKQEDDSDSSKTYTPEKTIKLSRNGKNVIILMMDRMQSQHIPFIFDEKPELMKSFQGFVYYPNMVSPGAYTVYAHPALFGGYYYNPMEMQKRPKQRLKDKYDESLQVLPRIMAQNDFDVLVSNVGFFDESEAFAKQIFSDVPNIEAKDIITKYINNYVRGRLPITNSAIKVKDYDPIVKKSLFQFSLFKCSPYAMRKKIYNNGGYMNVDDKNKGLLSNYTRAMLRCYLSLLYYPEMTEITDDGKKNCVIVANELPHCPAFLQYPNYELAVAITNKGTGMFSDNPAYHVAMLSILLISKWFDYLKENGIWDNAKIIILSDHGWHGYNNNIPTNITVSQTGGQLQKFNNVLMIKDFGATKEFSVDSTFMTSADVPTLVTKGIIDNPVNPFTKKSLYTDKDSGVIIPITAWKPLQKHSEYTYDFGDDEWLRVKDNIFKQENWTKYSIEK